MSNYLVDYHLHSDNSFDSRTSILSQCQRALKLNFKEIVFTEHFDLNPKDEGLGLFNYEKYSREIEEAREKYGSKIKIKKGLEFGEPHLYAREHRRFIRDKDFDFFLGSVHYLGEDLLFESIGTKSEKEAYEDYFHEVYKISELDYIDSLAHLDVFKRYTPKSWQKFSPREYQESLEEILKNIIKNDIALEVNSSGFRQGLGESLPHPDILQWYFSLGGRLITIGSDSHAAKDLGRDIDTTLALLKEIGFASIALFEKRKISLKAI